MRTDIRGLKRPLTYWVLAGLFLPTLVGCGDGAKPPAQTPPPKVTIVQAVRRPVTRYLHFTGNTSAVNSVDVAAQVTGYLKKVNFKDGDKVDKGHTLFEIDPRPFEAALAGANAEVKRWQAALKKAESDVARNQKLRPSGAVSQEDLDASIAQRDQASAMIAKSKAQVQQAKLNLQFATIEAPIAGRVGRAQLTEGNLISGPTTLTTLVSVDPMYVYFNIDEKSLIQAQKSAGGEGESTDPARVRELKIPVEFQLPGEDGYPHKATLDFVDNRVDPQTGTVLARGIFDNSKLNLLPGVFVNVRMPAGKPKPRVLVPQQAIASRLNQRYVLIVDGDGRVEYQAVEPAFLDGGLRVVEAGLNGDEWVIANGIQRARPGTKVDAQKGDISDFVPQTGGATASPPASVQTQSKQ